jgi:glycine hydroxymethyltransferase
MIDEAPRSALALERLRVPVRLGCSAAERAVPQSVELSVTLQLPQAPRGCWTDELRDTVPLDEVAERLRAVATSGEFGLIEHLGARLHQALVELCPPGTALELDVHKVAPPIAGLVGGTHFRLGAGQGGPQAAVNAPCGAVRLAHDDPEIFAAIRGEERRQADSVELIASENYTYPEVLAALGSVLGDKYAEGYPGRRYYAGNEHTDVVEELARERARQLFRAEHANVQPLSGSPMNQAVYLGLLAPGDTILAMDLTHGGHLTHGSPRSHMAKIFRFVRYRTRADGSIDHDELARLAREARPRLVLCGHSSYPRDYDYAAFRHIADEVGALTMADVSHTGGLIAGGVLANPLDHGFDVVTTTTHKTLRGPRAGLILCKREHARAIDASVFPGLQGGPHMNTIAAVAVALRKAAEPAFADYARAVLDNARALARALARRGVQLVGGGTDNHLLVLDTRASFGLDVARAERALELAGITTNKQLVPDDPAPPLTPSGVRVGTPAVTTRGFGAVEMEALAEWISLALRSPDDAAALERIRVQCRALCARFPIPGASARELAAQP